MQLQSGGQYDYFFADTVVLSVIMLAVVWLVAMCSLVAGQTPEVPSIPAENRYQIAVEATIYRNNVVSGR